MHDSALMLARPEASDHPRKHHLNPSVRPTRASLSGLLPREISDFADNGLQSWTLTANG